MVESLLEHETVEAEEVQAILGRRALSRARPAGGTAGRAAGRSGGAGRAGPVADKPKRAPAAEHLAQPA